MRWGKPPSTFILGTDHKKWNKWDILVAGAYEITQREKCGQCGLPRWMCQNDSNEIQFSIKKDECHAIAAKEKYEESHKKDKERPGVSLRPEPKMAEGRDPIELREPYYRALAALNGDPNLVH